MEKITIYDSISLCDQIARVVNILNNGYSYLIIVSNVELKIKVLKRLLFLNIIQSPELLKNVAIEKEISNYSDFIALFNDISIKNIIRVTRHSFTKQQLKVDWAKILLSNSMPTISDLPEIIKEAIEKTKISDNPIPIWSNQIPIFSDISITQVQNQYAMWQGNRINICIPEQIDELSFYNNIIIFDANNPIYNTIVPCLAKTSESKFLFAKAIAKVCLKADKLIFFNNLSDKNISYLLLYFKNIESIKKQSLSNQYIKPIFEGKGKITSLVLTPKNIKKLTTNPLFFYFEFILKLKKSATPSLKLSSFTIEKLISSFIQNSQLSELSSIIDKYKFLNKLDKAIKLIKLDGILKEKSVQLAQEVAFNIDGIEIVVRPDFTLYKDGEYEHYFYTDSALSAINKGKDVVANVILSAYPIKSHFINYNKNNLITIENVDTSQIKEIISYYKQDSLFLKTDQYSGFSGSYQHLSRHLLIK